MLRKSFLRFGRYVLFAITLSSFVAMAGSLVSIFGGLALVGVFESIYPDSVVTEYFSGSAPSIVFAFFTSLLAGILSFSLEELLNFYYHK